MGIVERTADAEREELLSLRAEVMRLREIIAGRSTPPTDAEIAAHHAACGWWLIAYAGGGVTAEGFAWPSSRDWQIAHGAVRWHALGADRRPCAWPVTP